MKLHFQGAGIVFPEPTQKVEIDTANVSNKSARYADDKNIQSIEQQNLIDGYFKIFNETHTDLEIKNLIAARLQPSYQLPKVHDMALLSAKADQLLNFSFSI